MGFIIQIEHYLFVFFDNEAPGQALAIFPFSAFKPVKPSDTGIIINLRGGVVIVGFMFAPPSMSRGPGWRTMAILFHDNYFTWRFIYHDTAG
jgi:hypothetical protein